MSHVHDHDHPHDHPHDHSSHDEPSAVQTEAIDLTVPDAELSPRGLDRRRFLRSAGLLGAGAAAASVIAQQQSAAADPATASTPAPVNGLYWLSGDHHIHTQYSPDAQYRVTDQVRHAAQNNLDWMVITDHGSVAHALLGVEKVNPDIRAARKAYPDTMVFQGLEWNIPAAEHGTVFVAPGPNEVSVLKQFENSYDGVVNSATDPTPQNESLAISGLAYLTRAVRQKQVADALMFANHPSRKGIDSPHEIRNWRDTAPGIAMGFEGAPGHQAAGIPTPLGAGGGRGEYNFSPSAASFPGYPLESYRTWGGFDFMTSTVGGLWDSLLAEGKGWWITSNSDSHKIYADWAKNPVDNNPDAPWDTAGDTFNNFGRYGDPVYAGGIQTSYVDFWPGYYSRTHVGATGVGYREVMAGLRAGRVWVGHGDLISGLNMQAYKAGTSAGVPLGGFLSINDRDTVELIIRIQLAAGPNFAQFQPKLNRVDLIVGDIVGSTGDRDSFTAPNTKVVQSWDTSTASGTVVLKQTFRKVDRPFYVRIRGTDGNRGQAGYFGADVDPNGPAMDVVGSADPWADLWFYSNPIFVLTPNPLPHARKR